MLTLRPPPVAPPLAHERSRSFIPVKKYESGDGMYFQLVLCLGIWVTGLVLQMARGEPTFYPISMLGGAIWATGNVLCVPIITKIGLGPGLLIWGCTSLVIGWFTGFFGLFGLTSERDEIAQVGLNVAGLAFACASICCSFMLRPSLSGGDDGGDDGDDGGGGSMKQPLVSVRRGAADDDADADGADDGADGAGSQNGTAQQQADRKQGMIYAVVAGLFFGSNFDPPTYAQVLTSDFSVFYLLTTYSLLISTLTSLIVAPTYMYAQEHYANASQDPLDYVFAHFCGVLLTSIFWFLVYCAKRAREGREPDLYPAVTLPAFVSGLMWAVAQIGCV